MSKVGWLTHDFKEQIEPWNARAQRLPDLKLTLAT
jgi:hypothetical protein